jgi:S-adenosylmethionine hydrolase
MKKSKSFGGGLKKTPDPLAPPIITLTTDFGAGSPYVAVIKGVILSLAPAATVVDLTHQVPPQDVRYGALVLADATPWFPPATVHVAVVDPGVGTERAIIVARIGAQVYVAPDNGLLSRLTRTTAPSLIVELTDASYWRSNPSSTFHGRDIMAPVAARLAEGLDPLLLGNRRDTIVELPWPEPSVGRNAIDGVVLTVDSFGNLISNIPAELLAQIAFPCSALVACGGREVHGISRTYADRSPGELTALVGSNGLLEIAVVNGNASSELRAGAGADVRVRWTTSSMQ